MRVLVAGIGNVFLGDDGFGVEVARHLAERSWPDGVDVADYGIRGVHLAYDLLDAEYDALVLVDAVPVDEPPGTVVVLDATGHAAAIAADHAAGTGAATVEAHSMSPDTVLRALHGLGGRVDRVFVVGCRPVVLEEGIGLSEAVAGTVVPAGEAVERLVAGLTGAPLVPADASESRAR